MIVASILTPLEDLLRHILNALHSVGLPWAWAIDHMIAGVTAAPR